MAKKSSGTVLDTRIAWRQLSAFIAVLIVAGCMGTGFVYYLSGLQVAIVCGIVGGLISTSLLGASATSGAAALLGTLLMPNLVVSTPAALNAVLIGLGTAVFAAGVRWVVSSAGSQAGRWFYWVAIAIMVGNLWATALTVGGMTSNRAPLFYFLEHGSDTKPRTDDEFYVRVKNLVAEGKGYYRAYAQGVDETWGGQPGSVLAVRPPTFFWFWSALPRTGAALAIAYLMVASAATIAATFIARSFVRAPYALVGAAAVAAHFLSRAISRDLTYTEPWVGAIALICVLFALRAIAKPGRNLDLIAAVVLAMVIASIRELGGFALAAGLIGSCFLDPRYRVRHLIYWGVGAVAAAVGYVFHFGRADDLVDNSLSVSHWLGGNPGNVLLAITYGGQYQFLGNGPVLPTTMALMGIVGGLYASRGAARAFLAAALGLPLLFFAVASNNAIATTGAAMNYWGLIILPTMFALAPAAFAFIPGTRVRAVGAEAR